ncbi:MAG TPA: serine/threonine-protein kinase [Pyrinomonadaceae bacterium]|jgi:serine/threonine protein kinase
MSPERWQQVEEVLQAALDQPAAERASFLAEACAGDRELEGEAEQLLSAHEEAGEFLELPAIARDAWVLFGEATADAHVGRVVGPYRITGRLGAGGMGEVYLAQDARLGRAVALKILHDHFARDGARLRRFQREARAASALNHPNILTIHEVGERDGLHFISTEFIDGRTLRELIASNALSLEEVLDIGVQLASALSAAHAAGIIHRDVKPENVMRRGDQLVKILDFGIAKLTEQPSSELSGEAPTLIKGQTEAGMVMGTAGYMSPEQARGLGVDERTDVWGLGCVLYEMLAGRAPFAGETRVDTLVSVLEREPAPLLNPAEDAPAELLELQRIVMKALSKERSARYSSAAEMLEDLRGVSRSVSVNLKGSETLKAFRDGRESATLSPALSSSTNRSVAAALAEQQARASQRRIVRALIAVGLMLAAVVLTYVYNRSSARRAATPAPAKLYTEMTEAERLAFIDDQEQKISAQMGEHPGRLDEDALRAIKRHVDAYAARLGSTSTQQGEDDLRVIYARAAPYLPLIGRAFSERKVPVLVGIYLPMIESEYTACLENEIGAKGLYQFLPRTAQLYGVERREMCDAEKMTPAAAHYIADRMAELGDDAQSMTLVILSFNSGADHLRDSLRLLRETGNSERNFWTLLANRDRLDATFRNENAYYVPRFFAAAIIGENPQTFTLQTPPLTTLAGTNTPAKP